VLQGTPCRAGNTAEVSDDGGELLHCTLAERSVIAVAIVTAGSGSSTQQVACTAGQEIEFGILGRLLERCVLAEATTACAGGEEIVFSGDGLDVCTLAAGQRVGPFDLPEGAHIKFTQGSAPSKLPTAPHPWSSRISSCRPAPPSRYATDRGRSTTC